VPKIADVRRTEARKIPLCGHVMVGGGAICALPAGHQDGHEPVICDDLTGTCKTARLVAEGVITSTTDAEGWHQLCPVATIDGKGRVHRCQCTCHEVHLVCLRCAEVQQPDDLNPHTLRCLDEDACTERFKARLAANPKAQKWAKIREAAAEKEAEKAAANPRERRVKTGRCHHCGEPTKGGAFLAGHDMKLKGELIRASQAGDVQACAELMARGWHRSQHSDAATEIEAQKIVDATPTHVYLEARNEARWAQ
jgi:hypothetical protein